MATVTLVKSANGRNKQVRPAADSIRALSVGVGGTAEVFAGTATPEGAVTAPVGSLFLRTDGGTATTLYVKETGSGNTGWAAVGGASPGGGTSITVHQVGHGLSTGDAVYYDANAAAWVQAQSDNVDTLGIALVVVSGNDDFTAYPAGPITGLSGLTAGQYYFVSDDTAGAITVTEPVATTSYSNPILYAYSTTEGFVLPFRPSSLNPTLAGNLAGDVSGDAGSNVVDSIQGVVITGTPGVGDVLTATAVDAAEWAPGGGATTLLDLDFTAQSSETISSTTTRSWGGVTWDVWASSWTNVSLVMSASGAAMTSAGTGRVMFISAPFSEFGLSDFDDFRMSVYLSMSANVASGVTSPSLDLGTRYRNVANDAWLGSNITGAISGWGASAGVYVNGIYQWSDGAVSGSFPSYDTITWERIAGVYRVSYGVYSAGFPAASSRILFAQGVTTPSGLGSLAGVKTVQNRIYVDLRNNNSSPYTITLKRLLVEKL